MNILILFAMTFAMTGLLAYLGFAGEHQGKLNVAAFFLLMTFLLYIYIGISAFFGPLL